MVFDEEIWNKVKSLAANVNSEITLAADSHRGDLYPFLLVDQQRECEIHNW